jgi:hypothetical protein
MILALLAGPALAGGHGWDGERDGASWTYHARGAPCGGWRERGYDGERRWDRRGSVDCDQAPEEDISLSGDFFDDAGGVGGDVTQYGGGGGGGFVYANAGGEAGGFGVARAGAFAFASASASASASISFRFHGGFHGGPPVHGGSGCGCKR